MKLTTSGSYTLKNWQCGIGAEDRTRNALVKGEGVVWLHCPLPLNTLRRDNGRGCTFSISFESRGAGACHALRSREGQILPNRHWGMPTDELFRRASSSASLLPTTIVPPPPTAPDTRNSRSLYLTSSPPRTFLTAVPQLDVFLEACAPYYPCIREGTRL